MSICCGLRLVGVGLFCACLLSLLFDCELMCVAGDCG